MGNGTFSGNPLTEWLTDNLEDRNMRLLAPFWYIDPQGRRWEAPAGSIIDGASIPRTLWSSVGSPFTGPYRRASILHDVAVLTPSILRGDADTMFFSACLAGGCTMMQGKLLYAGVRLGAWADEKQLFTLNLNAAPVNGFPLPGQQSPQELEVRALYTMLASDLGGTADDFAAIRAAVDRRLAKPGRGPGRPPSLPGRSALPR
ncbi:MAG: DUF1353 domain-containing protein [Pseudomonadota bacterium]